MSEKYLGMEPIDEKVMSAFSNAVALNKKLELTQKLGLTDASEVTYFEFLTASKVFKSVKDKSDRSVKEVKSWLSNLFPKLENSRPLQSLDEEKTSSEQLDLSLQKTRADLVAKVGEERTRVLERSVHDLFSRGLFQARKDNDQAGIRTIALKLSEKDIAKWSDRWTKELG